MKILTAIITSVLAVGIAEAQMPNAAPGTPSAASSAAAPNSGHDAAEERKIEAHIKDLHRELKITAAEEPQWDKVAKTMRENAQDIDQAIDKRDASITSATAVENLNAYADVVQAHAEAVKKLADSFSGLYAAMSDSQKKTADEIFSHRRHGKMSAKN